MSEIPPEPAPAPASVPPAAPSAVSRPGGLTTICIIAMIWAALGMISAGLGWVQMSTDPKSGDLLDQMKQERLLWFWTLASTAIGLILAFLLFASALGARSLLARPARA